MTDASAQPSQAENMVTVVDLRRHFSITKGILFRRQLGTVRAVDGVTFSIARGETFSIVGESGCGKTTTARMLLGLEKPSSGTIEFLDSPNGREVQAVFQDPYSSLNPRMRVGDIVAEPLRGLPGMSRTKAREMAAATIAKVGLDPAIVVGRYPHMFSGGQRQRIAIARAIIARPSLVVLDEAVSAIDVSIRAQILNLLVDLQQELGMAYLMISHDLATVRFISKTVAVMYRGKFVEMASAENLFANPLHPYTEILLEASRPRLRLADQECLDDAEDLVVTDLLCCPLHPFCPKATSVCRAEAPPIRMVADRQVACHNVG